MQEFTAIGFGYTFFSSFLYKLLVQNRLALKWIKKDGGRGRERKKHFKQNLPRPGSLYFCREVLANPASTYRWHSNLPFRSLLLICPTPTWELSVLTSLLWLPASSATQEH